MNQYDSASLYQGTITSQVLAENRDGDPQLRLGVEVTHRMKGKTEADGVETLSDDLRSVKTIYFSFAPKPEQIERNFRDLKNLGLNSPNIEILNPSHPNALDLVGKGVCVKPRYTPDTRGGADKDWWNLVFPSTRAPEISPAAISKYKEMNKNVLSECFARAQEPRIEKVGY